MMAVEIVAAGPAHAAVVAALHAATIGAGDAAEGWSAAWVARILALPGAICVLALARDPPCPVGFALSLPAGEAFDLAAVGVLPERRRAGIARRLLARCEDGARAAGARRVVLEVADDNEAARAFYAAAGFGETGRRRGYYRVRAGAAARDALVLSKEL